MTTNETPHDLGEIAFHTTQELYQAYMPYIKKGAIFIETRKTILPGDNAMAKITIEEGGACHLFELESKVVWVTPLGAQNGLKPGIGLSLSEGQDALRTKIEGMLAGMTHSTQKTLTM